MLNPEIMTLGQLHEVIQMVMGWTNDRLRQFVIRCQRYGEAREGSLQFSTAATALLEAQVAALAARLASAEPSGPRLRRRWRLRPPRTG
ncbi:IS1096 element passenger TnpR family protein [Cupriavidus necator]